MELKFFRCEVCGNIVCKVEDSNMPLTCCQKQMTELKVQSTDGALEKHVPVFEIDGNKVKVKIGEVDHPMETGHHIEFVAIQTDLGFQIHYLMPTVGNSYDHDAIPTPSTCFKLCHNEKLLRVYEYCNLHGLYVAQNERKSL